MEYFEKLKEQLERQIITVMDFLFSDKKIDIQRLKQVSHFSLNYLDKSNSVEEFKVRLDIFLSTFPEFKPFMKKSNQFLKEMLTKQ